MLEEPGSSATVSCVSDVKTTARRNCAERKLGDLTPALAAVSKLVVYHKMNL